MDVFTNLIINFYPQKVMFYIFDRDNFDNIYDCPYLWSVLYIISLLLLDKLATA